MELAHLRYFREVARLGSMTAAARALGLSQPTLSVAVRQLEEELGAALLQRHRGGASLTAAGAELLRHADEVFALLDRAAASIAGLERDLVGQFVLGCHESLGAYFLPGFMSGFWRSEPRIELSLWNAPSAAVEDADFERLRPHGFSDDDIWDIAAIAAFFALSNRMASLTDMRPNDEFYMMGRVPKA